MPKRRDRSQPAPAAPAFVPPYPASWLNRLIDWIDRRPGPAWLSYAAALALLAGLTAAVNPDDLVFSLYPVYIVALMHHLDLQARSSLKTFWPAHGGDDAEYSRVRYVLTTVPARGAWIATAMAVPLGFVFILGGEALSPAALLPTALAVAITTFNTAAFFVLAYHTVRQLRQVSRLHAEARTIDLLLPRPTYAFSRLTARTAIGVAAFAYFDFLINPPNPGEALPYFSLVGASLALVLAAFLLPLLGMHQRLQGEKARLETEVNQGVVLAYRRLQEEVRSKTYAHIDDLEKALSGLLRMREVIARLSTWPWQPETLRGVVAAVGLPVFIWLVQYGLQRILG